uniref:Uncharacterized protein n=1 Tax=Tanacetum cinerariifolium TaxID=118510 RepID=A0A6L2KEU9_TANCI|nr:hypothetical protein [Tanacetum cinerariifolium]
MAGYKMKFFKGMTYDEIRPIFKREYNKIQTLFKQDKDIQKIKKKRVTDETLFQESVKKLRAAEVSGSESTQEIPTDDPKEIIEEDVQNMLEIVSVPEFRVEALQVNYPIIDWEINTEDMLKGFDREDLVAIWNLVKERFSSAEPIEDKERALWVELKRLFKPDANDVPWKLQRYMHAPLIWRLASTEYVEYLAEFWYTAKTLEDYKIWVSTLTGGIRGDIGYSGKIGAKETLKKSFLPPRWRLLMGQIIQCLDQTKSIRDGLKIAHADSSTNKESRANKISKKVKLQDLLDLLKDTISVFFTPDSLQDKPIIISDKSKEEGEVAKDKDTHASSQDSQKDELEKQKVTSKIDVASLKARPSYLDINQLTDLLVTSLKPNLSELLDSHNFASCLPTELKELPSKFIELSSEIKELKQATASLAEGEKSTTKDAETDLQTELVDLLGIDVVEQYHNKKLLFDKYYDKMLKRRKSSKIINYDVLTQKGPISLKVLRRLGSISTLVYTAVQKLKKAFGCQRTRKSSAAAVKDFVKPHGKQKRGEMVALAFGEDQGGSSTPSPYWTLFSNCINGCKNESFLSYRHLFSE